jgi:hypothetical protein
MRHDTPAAKSSQLSHQIGVLNFAASRGRMKVSAFGFAASRQHQNRKANSSANIDTISSDATIGKFPFASRCSPQNLIFGIVSAITAGKRNVQDSGG